MSKMTEVAEHINAMKRKYDTAVHVQEIQSLIRGNHEVSTWCGHGLCDDVIVVVFKYRCRVWILPNLETWF